MTKISNQQIIIDIEPLRAADRNRWNILARSYKTFYDTELSDSEYDEVWNHLLNSDEIFGFGAYLQGNLIDITHYLFHRTIWMEKVCYIQDLFVDEVARGRGVARALIEQVAQAAREHNASKLYWQTHQDNANARVLYDKIAHHKDFIRYDYSLE